MADPGGVVARGVGTHGSHQNPQLRILRVRVIKATHLAKKDVFGLSDPYCKIHLLSGHGLDSVIETMKTVTKKKTLTPIWNQEFDLRVNQANHKLLFEVFDENRLTRDDFLGQVDMPLSNIPTRQSNMDIIPKDYNLNPRSSRSRVRGSLKLVLYFLQEESTIINAEDIEADNILLSDNEPTPSNTTTPVHVNHFGSPAHRVTVTMPDVEEPSAPEQLPVLPEGWGERQDANGRMYYIDHVTRTTSWIRPTSPPVAEDHSVSSPMSIASPLSPTLRSTGSIYTLRRHLSVENDTVDTLEDNEVGDIEPMPPGWAIQNTSSGRSFFIDHNAQRTTWRDPRHSVEFPSGRSPELPAPAILKQDLGPLPPGWEERVFTDSRVFYIDHNTHSTQWEDPREFTEAKPTQAVPYSRSYKKKYDYFRSQLKRPKNVPNKYDINVRRDHVLEDSFRAVFNAPNADYLRTRLWVIFDGEVGLDYGGLQREWFYLLSKEVFNPYYGLFEYSANDTYTLQINPNSGICNEEHLKYFKFIGRVAGMAVYHGKLLDAFFIRPFYKMMLAKKIDLVDMESVDSEYYNSLQWILDNDAEDLDLTFSVDEEFLGKVQVVELKKGGANIKLTNENKTEYIRLIIEWRFVNRVEKQMKRFMEGFNELVPQHHLKMFDERELELLMCGVAAVDIDDWRKNTLYRGEYHDQHTIIQWFWKVIKLFGVEDRTCLLQFVTGTSRVPMNGFAELYGSNGPQKFTIEPWGHPHSLPRAHTCFNRLDLPKFHSYHELKEKLKLAMYNTEGFDGVD